MNKLILFQNIILDKILKTKKSIKNKYDKTQITINLACNIIKSYKLEPWFIKKAAKL